MRGGLFSGCGHVSPPTLDCCTPMEARVHRYRFVSGCYPFGSHWFIGHRFVHRRCVCHQCACPQCVWRWCICHRCICPNCIYIRCILQVCRPCCRWGCRCVCLRCACRRLFFRWCLHHCRIPHTCQRPYHKSSSTNLKATGTYVSLRPENTASSTGYLPNHLNTKLDSTQSAVRNCTPRRSATQAPPPIPLRC
jgi:hypothetical protein